MKRLRWARCVLCVLLTGLLAAVPSAVADDTPPQAVIVVVGAEGTAEYGAQFRAWAARWQAAAAQGHCDFKLIGYTAAAPPNSEPPDSEPRPSEAPPAAAPAVPGADPVKDPQMPPETQSPETPATHAESPVAPEPAAGAAQTAIVEQTAGVEQTGDDTLSDLDQLRQALAKYGSQPTTEPVWLVLLGHGTFDGRQARFGLSGPDLSADELAAACRSLDRPLAVIACFSSSAPFVNALSGEQRVVISATKDAGQLQYSRFGDALSQAIGGLDADINRDGQTSLLEAWLFAARRTAEFYVSEGRLATEHSLLDDNGDQRGTRSEVFDGLRLKADVEQPELTDGKLAARWHLVRSAAEQLLTAAQREQRDELEAQLEALYGERERLEEAEYLQRLEEILLPLARIYEAADPTPPPE